MKGYIYETTNLINGKKYIGKHTSSTFDNNYYGSGKHFKEDFNRLGKENFKVRVLEEIEDLDKLDKLETYYIELFDAVRSSRYYNNSYGGENEGWRGVNKMFRENPDKWRVSRQKSSKSQTGQKRSEETKRKISEALKGKPKSEKHLANLRKARRNYSPELRHKLGLNFGTLGKSSPIKGKTAENSEWVKKCRDNMKATKNSNNWKNTVGVEARKKLSKTRLERGLARGKNNPMYGVHTAYVSNVELDTVKRVPLEEVDKYLSTGWLKCNIHKMKR